MKVTKKLLIKLINEFLVKVEIPWTATKIYKSRFRSEDYQAGAYYWYVILQNNRKNDETVDIFCFYPFWEIEKYLEAGDKLVLDTRRGERAFGLGELVVKFI